MNKPMPLNRTLIDMQMDRFRPSIDRRFGPCIFDPSHKRLHYRMDENFNIYGEEDYQRTPKYKVDIHGTVFAAMDHKFSRPIGFRDQDGNIVLTQEA